MRERVMQVKFEQQMLKQAYERKVSDLGDRLPLIKQVVDWNVFIPLIRSVFQDNEQMLPTIKTQKGTIQQA